MTASNDCSQPAPRARRRRHNKPRRGRPNNLELDVDGVTWGPAMAALNERQKKFVIALFQVRPGHGCQVRAAKAAGYGRPSTTPETWAAIASRLAHDEKIQAGIREWGERYIRANAPRALRALTHLIETPSHRDHARGIAMVLDRVHPAKTTHRVAVEHKHRHRVEITTEKALERIRELAARAGLDPLALPPTIDGTCDDITGQESAA
jgi:phage terminase small subunit